MDLISLFITAIIIGAVVSHLAAFIFGIAKGFREASHSNSREDALKTALDMTVIVQVTAVEQEGLEPIVLLYNAANGKYLTQGTNEEIINYIKTVFKRKSVFMKTEEDGEYVLLKPAEIDTQ